VRCELLRASDAVHDRHESGPRLVLGIDPGPTTSGVALYDARRRRLVWSCSDAQTTEVEAQLAERGGIHRGATGDLIRPDLVAIERVQSYGIAGGSLLRTSEEVGDLRRCCLCSELDYVLMYRREVLRALDVTGRGNRDTLVRERLGEMHGGSVRAAKGRKASPGPLYGIAGHAWQALAVAIAALESTR